jgi:hypothetical protein
MLVGQHRVFLGSDWDTIIHPSLVCTYLQVRCTKQFVPRFLESSGVICQRHERPLSIPKIRYYSLNLKQDLPSLPVPPLQQSLEKYLKVLKPIISDAEFTKSSKIVEEFGKTNGEGEALHRILSERAKSEINWVSTNNNQMYFV